MTDIIVRPAVGGDDGHDDRGTFDSAGAYVLAGNISGSIVTFFRCPNVTIPNKAKIVSATMSMTNNTSRSDTVSVTIKAADADNQAAPTSSGGLGSITRTTASVSWSFLSNSGVRDTSPDISTVIQEVIDRAGWVSGNALVVILEGTSTTNDYAQFYSYDGSAGDRMSLNITYTTISGVTAVFLSDFGVM